MRTFTTINPSTGAPLEEYPLIDTKKLELTLHHVEKARQTALQAGVEKRVAWTLQLAALLEKKAQSLALKMTLEMGKPITQALAEIQKCRFLCEYYAAQAPEFLRPEYIETNHKKSYRSFGPVGLILGIMPWNFPFWQVFRFAVPNILLGNGALLKHAPNVTGCAITMEKLFVEAGFPKGLFTSLIIDVDLVPAVIQHPLVQGVTLTGSTRAGQAVGSEAGQAIKKVVLELGGSDPYLILEDADIEAASRHCVQSRLSNTGQVCIAAKRLLVHRNIRKDFEAQLLHDMKQFVPGDPTEPGTTMGPMAREDLRQNLHQQVQRAIAEGAQLCVGAKIPDRPGFYYLPTLLTQVNPGNCAFEEELFGPVLCVTEIADLEEGIQLANQSIFGLGAAVFTKDIEKGERIALQLDAGAVAVNTFVASDPRLPFGGVKQSGFGRELSKEGMREFANVKTIIVG
ncbi:MAG: NAD-dependent succinate-semialdehyde dehydrogenase [Legionellaceae bacterium]|nr:NAD-dependent succinate-semialdehyde dehydrogenase [Legionellaceae bacterium]